jgi:hypothetical protein
MGNKLECADFRCGAGTDTDVTERQLGRRATGMAGVSARCSYGVPVALLCPPIIIREDGKAEPFPTMYWLTCPYLREKIGALEGGEAFASIRRRINGNQGFRNEVLSFSEAYKAQRVEMFGQLSGHVRSMLSEKATADLLESGPGGAKRPENLKCLHICLANRLSGMSDPIGAVILDLLLE